MTSTTTVVVEGGPPRRTKSDDYSNANSSNSNTKIYRDWRNDSKISKGTNDSIERSTPSNETTATLRSDVTEATAKETVTSRIDTRTAATLARLPVAENRLNEATKQAPSTSMIVLVALRLLVLVLHLPFLPPHPPKPNQLLLRLPLALLLQLRHPFPLKVARPRIRNRCLPPTVKLSSELKLNDESKIDFVHSASQLLPLLPTLQFKIDSKLRKPKRLAKQNKPTNS
jgi:hypothetical protein